MGKITSITSKKDLKVLQRTMNKKDADDKYFLDTNRPTESFNRLYSSETGLIKDITSLSWPEIIEGANKNLIQESCVGQEKTIMIGDTSYDVVLIGVNHDDKVSGGKVNTTWQLKNLYNTTYPMNSSITNSGGYGATEMHKTTLASIFNQIQEDVRNAIKPVIKKASRDSGSPTIVETNCNLFLLSEIEILGSIEYSASGEGTQYTYWQQHNNNNDRSKRFQNNPTHYQFWRERSPFGSSSLSFCVVSNSGVASVTNANDSDGVSFAFCI